LTFECGCVSKRVFNEKEGRMKRRKKQRPRQRERLRSNRKYEPSSRTSKTQIINVFLVWSVATSLLLFKCQLYWLQSPIRTDPILHRLLEPTSVIYWLTNCTLSPYITPVGSSNRFNIWPHITPVEQPTVIAKVVTRVCSGHLCNIWPYITSVTRANRCNILAYQLHI